MPQLPKIQIDEAILVAYTVPAQMTKSTSLSDRETVVFRILPKELLNRLLSISVDNIQAILTRVIK